jgi:hypothetical protein
MGLCLGMKKTYMADQIARIGHLSIFVELISMKCFESIIGWIVCVKY